MGRTLGQTWDIVFFFIFSLKFSALDHSSTAPPRVKLCFRPQLNFNCCCLQKISLLGKDWICEPQEKNLIFNKNVIIFFHFEKKVFEKKRPNGETEFERVYFLTLNRRKVCLLRRVIRRSPTFKLLQLKRKKNWSWFSSMKKSHFEPFWLLKWGKL